MLSCPAGLTFFKGSGFDVASGVEGFDSQLAIASARTKMGTSRARFMTGKVRLTRAFVDDL